MESILHPSLSSNREMFERFPVQHAMCNAFLPSGMVSSRSAKVMGGECVERRAGRRVGSLDPAALRRIL